jgi:hypothetical protein
VGWRTLFTSSTRVPFAASRWVLTYLRSTVAVAPPAITSGTGVPPLWKSGSDPGANRMPVTVTGSVERLRSTATPVTVKSVGTSPKSTEGGSAMSACSSPSPVSVTRRSPQPAQGVTARATRFTPARWGWKLTSWVRVSPGARVSGDMENSSAPAPTMRPVT